MPLIAATVSLADYKKILAKDLQLAESRALPFRLYQEYTFEDGKKGPLLVIGKPSKEVMTGVGERSKAVKGLGLCRNTDGGLQFQVKTGSIKRTDLTAMIKSVARTDAVSIVDDLSKAAESDDTSAIDTRLPDLLHDLAEFKKLDGVEEDDSDDLDKLVEQIKKIKAGKAKGNAEELLDTLEMGLTAAWEEAAKRIERANKKVDSSISDEVPVEDIYEPGPPPTPITKRSEWKQVVTALEELTASMAEALEWQKAEVESELEAETLLGPAQDSLDDLKDDLDTALDRLDDLQEEINSIYDTINDKKARKTRAKNSKTKATIQQEIDALYQDVNDAKEDRKQQQLVVNKARKAVQAQETLVGDLEVMSGKHGTGRHATQTGLESQVRRATTGGITADQDDNPYGLPHARFDEGGKKLNELTWKEVTLTWTEGDDGQRELQNRDEIEHKLTLAAETRNQKASASSLFHSPILEKEAVERAIAYVNTNCVWEEYFQGTWKPLDRVLIVIGKPKKAIGWGTSVKLTGTKTALADANKAIDQFHKGKVTIQQLMAALHVGFETDISGGVKLVPTARIMLDRTSTGWVNTSQYPCTGAVQWTIAGKKVRSRHPTTGNWVEQTAGLGNGA